VHPIETFARWLDGFVPRGKWQDQIYSYCERGGSSAFWAEPLNAYSNLAFHLAALLALALWFAPAAWRRGEPRRAMDLVLIALVFVIGTGSLLFHTLATRWAAVADTVPIGIFMVTFLGYAVKRWIAGNWGWIGWPIMLLALGGFYVMLWQSSVVRCNGGPCLNGSVAYFPALGALLLIGLYLSLRGHNAGKYLIAAGLIFAVSLFFRSIDKIWCPYSIIYASRPSGWHFLWHIFNAAVLFLCLMAALRHGNRRIASRA